MNCHLRQEIRCSGRFTGSLFYGHRLISGKIQSSAATLLLPPNFIDFKRFSMTDPQTGGGGAGTFFNTRQRATIQAAMARIIPTDDRARSYHNPGSDGRQVT